VNTIHDLQLVHAYLDIRILGTAVDDNREDSNTLNQVRTKEAGAAFAMGVAY
jgi:hypothetical protein